MTRLVVSTDPDGPVVPVVISLAAPDLNRLRAAGRAVPNPITVTALLDTGSEITVVDAGVLAPLVPFGLQPNLFVFTNTPAAGGVAITAEYGVGLVVGRDPARPRSGLSLPTHPVYERVIGAVGYQALVGRDVLAHCGMFYDGPGRQVTLLL